MTEKYYLTLVAHDYCLVSTTPRNSNPKTQKTIGEFATVDEAYSAAMELMRTELMRKFPYEFPVFKSVGDGGLSRVLEKKPGVYSEGKC